MLRSSRVSHRPNGRSAGTRRGNAARRGEGNVATSKRDTTVGGKRKGSSREARAEQSTALEALFGIAECVGSQGSSGEKLAAFLREAGLR